MSTRSYKTGLALSGGGVRGVAHIGVLQALEDHGLKPDVISGCSAGAVVAALYAAGCAPSEIFRFIEYKSFYKIIKMGLPVKGMMELAYFREVLEKEIPHDSFDELDIPLYLSVTNLNRGGGEIKHKGGHLIDYVIASATVPMVFNPVEIEGHLYVDGGVINNLPVEPLIGKCDLLIGVNVNPVGCLPKVSNIKDVGVRCLDISLKEHVLSRLEKCDLVIEPDVSRFGMFSMTNIKEIYQEGYNSAEAVILASEKTDKNASGTSRS